MHSVSSRDAVPNPAGEVPTSPDPSQPSASKMRWRKTIGQIRVNGAEYLTWLRARELDGYKRWGEWVRDRVNESVRGQRHVVREDQAELKEILSQLSHIGVNINQAVRGLNRLALSADVNHDDVMESVVAVEMYLEDVRDVSARIVKILE